MDWEKIFANHIFDEDLVPRIYTELSKWPTQQEGRQEEPEQRNDKTSHLATPSCSFSSGQSPLGPDPEDLFLMTAQGVGLP